MPVILLGTLDTKGPETAFVRDALKSLGVDVRLVDTGCLGEPALQADVSREDVFRAAGTTLAEVRQRNDRGQAVTLAAKGASALVEQWQRAGEVSGVIALGGSAGTTIGTAAMRGLPLGVPKLMVSTLASGQVRQYVGDKDILMLNSVVDILGINRISRAVLHQAARAMAGMVLLPQPERSSADKPLVAATMFGVTTPCVMKAKAILEEAGYEVLVFHATGNGGQAMESLIGDGVFAGVLDITTTELADEIGGGVLSAGPSRLTAAGKRGVPQVISSGATDMINFGPPDTVPEKFRGRKFHQHNPSITLMRTTVDECRRIGEWIGRSAAAATGPTAILLPKQGVSAIDKDGQSFNDPAARRALTEGILATCGSQKPIEVDAHINDPEFAQLAAETLLRLMTSGGKTLGHPENASSATPSTSAKPIRRTRLEAAEYVLERVQQLGLSINPTSRLGRMHRVLRQGLIPFGHPDFPIALEAVRDMHYLEFVFHSMHDMPVDDPFKHLVYKVLGDSVLPQQDKGKSPGRDSQFELYLAAICRSAKLQPVQVEEPDVSCVVELVKFGIAAKRIKSLRKLEKHVRKAADQISRAKLPGVIALDLTLARNQDNEPIVSPLHSQMLPHLYQLRDIQFFDTYADDIRGWVEKSNVRGVVIFDSALRHLPSKEWELNGTSMWLQTTRNDREENEYQAFYSRFVTGIPNLFDYE